MDWPSKQHESFEFDSLFTTLRPTASSAASNGYGSITENNFHLNDACAVHSAHAIN